ncbi:MAG: hypothetical protein HFG29_01290 [Eubacterium sp.]|nr:hypothetical protein [Eubacterium sp.]
MKKAGYLAKLIKGDTEIILKVNSIYFLTALAEIAFDNDYEVYCKLEGENDKETRRDMD